MQVLRALPSLLRMGHGEPFGLLGFFAAQFRAARKKEGPGNYFEDIGAIISFRSSWRLTHMTWPVVPWGLARILVYISETYKPEGGIYIMENGLAVAGEDDVRDACDERRGKPGARRVSYVRSHLVAVQRAIGKGANVRAATRGERSARVAHSYAPAPTPTDGRCAATSCGRSWTTSSGHLAMRSASARTTSTTRPSSVPPSRWSAGSER